MLKTQITLPCARVVTKAFYQIQDCIALIAAFMLLASFLAHKQKKIRRLKLFKNQSEIGAGTQRGKKRVTHSQARLVPLFVANVCENFRQQVSFELSGFVLELFVFAGGLSISYFIFRLDRRLRIMYTWLICQKLHPT